MLDAEFDDFLDSDDDAFFVQASNSFIDESFKPPENKGTLVVNVSQIPQNDTSSEDAHPVESKVPHSEPSKSNYFSSNDKLSIKKDLQVCKIQPGTNDSFKKESPDISTSLKSSISKISALSKNITTQESVYNNNRFTPGFTPQTKKRKLPGPAGLLDLFNESEDAESGNHPKILAVDAEFENIVSTQFTPEHLSLSSWLKLQAAVSSCSDLHSTAKNYSIKRVLKETSKKKLPKHMIVPVLCVLLKKIASEGSTTISVFMDDTGEIKGKIDADVLSIYKDYMVEGTAFILKKVTFLCNMLLLKSENLVSMYHPDNSEKHLHTLESILVTTEPLEELTKREILELSHRKPKTFSNSHNTPIHNKSAYVPHNSFTTVSKENRAVIRNSSNFKIDQSTSLQKAPSDVGNMRTDSFLEDLLNEDNCTDEFDELLGNLDEKSFMGEL